MEKIKNWFKKDHSTLIVWGSLTIIVILATLLCFYHIGKLSFTGDEIDTARFATGSLKSLIQIVWKSEPNMVLFYFLVHYWAQIFPHASDGLLRTLPAIFSVASIPVVFLLGRSMVENRKQATAIGLVASLLVTVNAFDIEYAQDFRSYSLVFLLTTLSTLLLIKAIEQPGSKHHWWMWYTIVSVAAIYSHLFAVFIIIAQAVSLLVLLLKNIQTFPFRKVVYSGIGMVILIIPVAVAALMVGATTRLGWIPEPTLSAIRYFVIEIVGNQGVLLLAFYLLAIGVGLLVGVRVWFQKDVITKWKFTLIIICLFLPFFMLLLISRVITPIFLDRYLLFIMPYMATLAATGIVALLTLGWKNWNTDIITIPIGIALLVVIVWLSVGGIKDYFKYFQKTDWRGASQFMTEKCSTSLRLYYWINNEQNAIYYNAGLKSQAVNWWGFMHKNPNPKEITKYLPSGYGQACLVLAGVNSQNYNEQKNIQSALKLIFPKVPEISKFYGVIVEIYSK